MPADPRTLTAPIGRPLHLLALTIALVLLGGLMPAEAAPKSNDNKTVISFEDPEYWAFVAGLVSSGCGFDVDAEVYGWMQIISFKDGQKGHVQQVELNIFHSHIILSANGNTVETLDVGPDRYYVRDGVMYLALTGRSLTGSGVIGHVVINLETGEVVHEAGNVQGDWLANVCAELAA